MTLKIKRVLSLRKLRSVPSPPSLSAVTAYRRDNSDSIINMREVVRLADFIVERRHWRPLLETWGVSAAAFLLQWNYSNNKSVFG